MAKNGCTSSYKSSTFLSVLVVFMLLVQGGKAGLYTCWGGCLNECIFLGSKPMGQRLPCYVNCLAKCFYPPGRQGTNPGPVNKPPSIGVPAPSPSDSGSESDSEVYADSDIDTASEIYENRPTKSNLCEINCYMQTCMSHNHGGSDLKSCLGSCINKCKDFNSRKN